MIVFAGGKRFALQVDEIQGVFHFVGGTLFPVPDNFDSAQSPYMSGVTKDGLAVIDLERLVSADGFGTDSNPMV